MNASKRLPLTLLKTSQRTSKCRNFHTTPICLAKYSRPSKPARQRVPRPGTPGTPSLDAENSLPPSVLLAAARKSGVIDLTEKAVVDFLEDYMTHEKTRPGKWEKEVCEKHKITPFTLTLLAGILRRSPKPSQHILGTRLLLSSSLLGSKEATYELIHIFLSSSPSSTSLHPTPQKELAKLVAKSEPSALALHGKLLKHQGKYEEALGFLTRATEADQTFDGAGDALVEKGILLLKLKPSEKSLAHSAFQKAALEHDEPMAYYYLTRWEAKGSAKENVYLLKAASSGVLEAIVKLGQLELERVLDGQKAKRSPTPSDSPTPSNSSLAGLSGLKKEVHIFYGIAAEWIRLAAERGDQTSMLHLGCMLRSMCDEEGWREWKGRVGDVKGWEERTVRAREWWDSKGVDFLE